MGLFDFFKLTTVTISRQNRRKRIPIAWMTYVTVTLAQAYVDGNAREIKVYLAELLAREFGMSYRSARKVLQNKVTDAKNFNKLINKLHVK